MNPSITPDHEPELAGFAAQSPGICTATGSAQTERSSDALALTGGGNAEWPASNRSSRMDQAVSLASVTRRRRRTRTSLLCGARAVPCRFAAASWGSTSRTEGARQREGREAHQIGQANRFRASHRALLVTALLGPLVTAMTLAGCAASVSIPNPPANTLQITVSVYDHESADHAPSDTTLLTIFLASKQSSGGAIGFQAVEGTDAQTLVCDGVQMHFVGTTNLFGPSLPPEGSYAATVPPQSGAYTCTYFWNQGAQQATLTIPVLIATRPSIQTPASRAMLQWPTPGGPGITLTYAPAGNSGASVMATARDYDSRTASSDQNADSGTVVIDAQRFPHVFSVGWGTLSLTRSISSQDLGAVGTNSAFASVNLSLFEQAEQIPIYWI
jgi:hypothetical protein